MPKSSHITSDLKYLHRFKINESIKYKLLSLTYKVLTTNQPQYLHLVTTHVRSSWSLFLVHLPGLLWKSLIALFGMLQPVPCLWNELPTDLREPRQIQSPSLLPITQGSSSSSSSPSSLSPLASSLLQSFILNLRLAFSANHFLHRPFPFLTDWFYGHSDHFMFLFCSAAGLVCMLC